MPPGRSAAVRSKTLLPHSSLPHRTSPLAWRSVSSASATVESLMQLHSAIASVRFRSFIAVDSSSWSWLSQDNGFISKLQNLILLDKGHGFTSNACI
nr:PREDICTED: uncharacterized protein LOC103975472 [Musa acuminata subsp. malaccensis]